MNFLQFPTLFAKLNLPQRRLALRSINKSKGRICAEAKAFLDQVEQMSEGTSKKIVCQSGLCLVQKLFCTVNSRQFITSRDCAQLSSEWAKDITFCS